MGLLEQLEALLSIRVSELREREDACRGARMLGPAARAQAEKILYRSPSGSNPDAGGVYDQSSSGSRNEPGVAPKNPAERDA